MNDGRRFAGWLCVALGFAVNVLVGHGVLGPITVSTTDAPASLAAMLFGLLPTVLGALALFVLGLWLLKGSRRGSR
ncbi:hypothetical protein [Aerolutibacter ruishenii]|uniref:Uncharacterized protein n=1 Tax=Aerolutibacter ruishenii TaxID=686800 RepID=A0A562M3A6_9GAMM|nr:hypothetical protein [Lysobacter ruishenii]TWI14427.1 hypothetical protein IP93_00424 [Lysobacter ruishenii]